MSNDDSENKDSNGIGDNPPQPVLRSFRPRSKRRAGEIVGVEDHNLFVSVTFLKTGEVIYLDRLNTNDEISPQHYVTTSGEVRFILDLTDTPPPNNSSAQRRRPLGLSLAKESECGRMCGGRHKYHFYYTGSEPVGYSFSDVNITVFIATREEERAWYSCFPERPGPNAYFCFSDNPELRAYVIMREYDYDDRGIYERARQEYNPRPPMAANAGHGLEKDE